MNLQMFGFESWEVSFEHDKNDSMFASGITDGFSRLKRTVIILRKRPLTEKGPAGNFIGPGWAFRGENRCVLRLSSILNPPARKPLDGSFWSRPSAVALVMKCLESVTAISRFVKGDLRLPTSEYRYAVIAALLADERGDRTRARALAQQSLAMAAKVHSGLRYHPTLGLFGAEQRTFETRLRQMAGN